ncbi:MAG: hypothetical protein PVJ52_01415 [Candidatus Woesebacteria bacterium]
MSLTIKDLDIIEKIVDERISERIKYLPTKDEFFTKMDELMSESKNIRENTDSLTYRVSKHEDRISKIKKRISSPISS